MLPHEQHGQRRPDAPSLVLMHFFGSSRREWEEVIPLLAARWHCVALDMPGFGDAADLGGQDVATMAAGVRETIEALGLERAVLVGHSFTGKVSMVVAHWAPDWLEGLYLVAPSPATAQPVSAQENRFQLEYQGDRAGAERFIDGARVASISTSTREHAIEDAMRGARSAWRAWATHGYLEDWSERVGELSLPAAVIVSAQDPSCPPGMQRELVMPQLAVGELEVIEGFGHLLPMECPRLLAERIDAFAGRLPG
ncbi:alpha/beta fold hydrolase [Halotalea alkalilenta]|uniref:AB hydrolase-1 domain-containing protein n=1 Tax=Halotalea alkalilenta TaxID=376489 RepID=A0A172YIV5_9GAMM|nr:alpha/beta hydrolase [Halotalea alkalilenta]ANF59116.1 hypothetical protein A5892_17965 [Halotalea alkalilenta]